MWCFTLTHTNVSYGFEDIIVITWNIDSFEEVYKRLSQHYINKDTKDCKYKASDYFELS